MAHGTALYTLLDIFFIYHTLIDVVSKTWFLSFKKRIEIIVWCHILAIMSWEPKFLSETKRECCPVDHDIRYRAIYLKIMRLAIIIFVLCKITSLAVTRYLLAFRLADVNNKPLDLESWKIMWFWILNVCAYKFQTKRNFMLNTTNMATVE